MAADPFLLERIENTLLLKEIQWVDKKMFGGVCYMVDDKMLMGTFLDGLLVRVGPEKVEELKDREGVEQMEMKGRPMKAYLHLHEVAYESDEDLAFWVDLCMAFNPIAESSKKKKKKK
jgi:TfoX/Sxy family transcriptional regulator of competence genes